MSKVRSNNKVSFNFIVAISLNETSTTHHDSILQWFLEELKPIKHPDVWDGYQFNWNIVSSIRDNDYFDEYDSDCDSKGTTQNTQYILIRTIGRNEYTHDEHMLINQEYSEPSMCASVISESINPDIIPGVVDRIGISGVSTEYMNSIWNDLISEEPNSFDVPGDGFMVHPMWNLFHMGEAGYEWSDIREMSYNFGRNWVKAKTYEQCLREKDTRGKTKFK